MQGWKLWMMIGCLTGSMACGGVGEVCEQPGTTTECGEEKVCTPFGVSTQGVCLRICEGVSDCGAGELCATVPGSNLRSCQTT
jgi:hypothetical protein